MTEFDASSIPPLPETRLDPMETRLEEEMRLLDEGVKWWTAVIAKFDISTFPIPTRLEVRAQQASKDLPYCEIRLLVQMQVRSVNGPEMIWIGLFEPLPDIRELRYDSLHSMADRIIYTVRQTVLKNLEHEVNEHLKWFGVRVREPHPELKSAVVR